MAYKCKDCDPFKHYDALVILTRQGNVMTSNDAQLTINEDAELYKIGKIIAARAEKAKECCGKITFPEDW